MNWARYYVEDHEFRRLVENNEPIPVPNGELEPNSGVEVYSSNGMLNAVYDAELGAIRKLNGYNPQFTSFPNRDLLLLNDHLLNEHVNTIVVDGFFGTGKTSMVCAHLVEGLLKQMRGEVGGIPVAYLSKPHESLGKTYGHLPGDLFDKTYEEFTSFFQYFDRFGVPYLVDVLMGRRELINSSKPEQPLLYVLVFEYLRGRDIDSGWVVLDEAQNTDVKDMSAFISRVGDEAKLIILGDTTPTQIDKKGNTPENNGLTFAKEIFAGKKYAGYVEMQSVKHIIRGQRVKDLFLALKN